MSKCLICGNELITGDIHWEQGMCNVCWNKTFNKDIEVVGVDLIDIYKDKILILEQQLAEKEKEIRHQVCDEIKEKILICLELPKEEWVWYCDSYVGVGLIKEILDQIEQAKESLK